jgi:hypothetical protein
MEKQQGGHLILFKMTEEKNIRIMKREKVGKDERSRCLMLVEDQSIRGSNRFATAISPHYHPEFRVGNLISKTREINYVKPHMEGIDKAREMYEKLVKESR